MKLSKLIELLQSDLDEYGDVTVVVSEGFRDRDLEPSDMFVLSPEPKLVFQWG